MEIEDEEDDPEDQTKCQVCVKGCKHVTAFILSHVGLLTLVVGYCMIGALAFEALGKFSHLHYLTYMLFMFFFRITEANNEIQVEFIV